VYINKILLEITTEENAEQTKIIQEVNHPPVYKDDDDNNNNNNNPSTASSSLPRVRTFMENISLNKNDHIKE
jgi:hypothetical protein